MLDAAAIPVYKKQPEEHGLQPSAEDVRAQLQLVASPDLDFPARARRFLSYVVEETLAGRADRIKAYTIGTRGFRAHADFDAQSDPAVRIEAGRLRRALERYYLSDGRSDPVVITIPKGAYVPHFSPGARAGRGAHRCPAAVEPGPPVGSPPRRSAILARRGSRRDRCAFVLVGLSCGGRGGRRSPHARASSHCLPAGRPSS